MVVTGVMEPGTAANVDGGGHTISSTMLLAELDRFLSLALTTTDKRSHSGRRDGISEGEEQTMAETALFLLRNLPPARPAALAFLAHTLSKQVRTRLFTYAMSLTRVCLYSLCIVYILYVCIYSHIYLQHHLTPILHFHDSIILDNIEYTCILILLCDFHYDLVIVLYAI